MKLKLYFCLLVGLFLSIGAPCKSEVTHSTCIKVESPLYVAYVGVEEKVCHRIEYSVNRSHLGNVGEKRRFYTPPELRDFCLEHEDYVNSGFDRGHLRALTLSAGSEHYDDVNNMAVVVPMSPFINRDRFRKIERYIERLAQHGTVRVIIECKYNNQVVLPNADESHKVPSSFQIEVTFGGTVLLYESLDNTFEPLD